MTVWTAEDRSMAVTPEHHVRTSWIDIDWCRLGNRTRMAVGDIDTSYRKLVCLGDNAPWPCIVGHWTDGERFTVDDGRHEYVASLMMGREKVFVAWIERI